MTFNAMKLFITDILMYYFNNEFQCLITVSKNIYVLKKQSCEWIFSVEEKHFLKLRFGAKKYSPTTALNDETKQNLSL